MCSCPHTLRILKYPPDESSSRTKKPAEEWGNKEEWETEAYWRFNILSYSRCSGTVKPFHVCLSFRYTQVTRKELPGSHHGSAKLGNEKVQANSAFRLGFNHSFEDSESRTCLSSFPAASEDMRDASKLVQVALPGGNLWVKVWDIQAQAEESRGHDTSSHRQIIYNLKASSMAFTGWQPFSAKDTSFLPPPCNKASTSYLHSQCPKKLPSACLSVWEQALFHYNCCSVEWGC